MDGFPTCDIEGEELVSNHGIQYRDFVYIYNDPDNNEWTTMTAFFENNNRLHVLFAIVISDYYDIGQTIYSGIIDSLQLD